nr:MAG: internal scaffolding protein [Microvirus sp.]
MSKTPLATDSDKVVNSFEDFGHRRFNLESRLTLRRERRRADPGTLNSLPSKTDESQAEAANINTIIKRMMKGNYTPPMRGFGEYRDAVLESNDLQTALMIAQEGSEIFEKLPAETRLFFNNDPMELHKFLMDPNIDVEKGIELGLFQKTGPDIADVRPETTAKQAVVPPEPNPAPSPAPAPEKK